MENTVKNQKTNGNQCFWPSGGKRMQVATESACKKTMKNLSNINQNYKHHAKT